VIFAAGMDMPEFDFLRRSFSHIDYLNFEM
jgi:hypothetical protein